MPKSRPAWLMTAPLVAVLLLAVGWSVFWYITLENAKQRFALELERATAAGRMIKCAEPAWGGFPFRVALECTQFGFETEADGTTTEFTSGSLNIVALAYRPQHLIAEIHGPITMSNDGDEVLSLATGDVPLRASLVWSFDRAEQLSLLAENVSGSLSLPTGDRADFTAGRANIHMRLREPDGSNNAALDIVARIDDVIGSAPPIPELGEETLQMATVQLDGTATDMPLDGHLSFSERARAWQEGGGRFEVRLFRIDSNLLDTQSSGELLLDDQGRVEGDLRTAVRGFDEFLIRLRDAGMITDEQARGAEAILIVLGKASGDPEDPAIEIETAVKMGRFYFGPFKILRLPSLF